VPWLQVCARGSAAFFFRYYVFEQRFFGAVAYDGLRQDELLRGEWRRLFDQLVGGSTFVFPSRVYT